MASFDQIQQRIDEYIASQPITHDDPTDTKLPLSDAIFCASDIPRNRLFRDAIAETIAAHPHDQPTILDAGAGTCILSIFALALGASHATCLEHNTHTIDYAH